MFHAIVLYFYHSIIDAIAKVRFDIAEATAPLYARKFEKEMLETKPAGCGPECPICFPPSDVIPAETGAAFAAAGIPVPTPGPVTAVLTPEVARDLAKDDLVDQAPEAKL